MKLWQKWCVLVVVSLAGCSANSPGNEAAARQHFGAEFKKWMAGEKSEVTTLTSRGRRLKPPISYDIRSLVKFTPDVLACESVEKVPNDWKSWPAFKVNVATEWQTEDSTPMTVITTYRMTWNTAEKRWYVKEYF